MEGVVGPILGAVASARRTASATVDCARSDGERQLGERSREPMPRVNVGGKFVVAAANVLDKGMADADHPYGTDCLRPRIGRGRAFNRP
jgi:hypothetical protein